MPDDEDDEVSWQDRQAIDRLTRTGPHVFTEAERREQKDAMRPLWAAIQKLLGKALPLLLLAGPLWGQTPGVTRHYTSTTHCDMGRARSDPPTRGMTSRDSIETVAHEAVHRRQLAAGCDSVYALWSRDLAAKMSAEAEALCVGMRAAGLSDLERKQRVVEASKWWSQFQGQMSFAEYLATFTLWCVP